MTGARSQADLDQALELVAHGRHADAETRFEALVEMASDLPLAWLALGKTRLALGKPREAYEAFGRAAEFLDTAAEARSRLGRLARPGPGDHLRERSFKIALLVEPSHGPALVDLADLLGGRVLGWFAQAIVSTPVDADPYRELLNRGWVERARRLARIVALFGPGEGRCQRDLATVVFRLEDFPGNARHLKRVAATAPDDAVAQIEAVDALFRIEEMDLAEIHAGRAVAASEGEIHSQTRALSLFWLGRVQRHRGDFEAARATFAETLHTDKDFDLRIHVVDQGIHSEDFKP